jgi:hypothetical protein
MARKVTADGNGAPAAPKEAAGADDLQVLSPDVTLTIGDEQVTVHEYRFFEGLALRAQAQPFFDDLYTMLGYGAQPPPSFDDLEMVAANHMAVVMSLVALSVKRPVAWVSALGDADGSALFMTWWQVNSGFFIQRVMRRAMQERLNANPSAGHASTTP